MLALSHALDSKLGFTTPDLSKWTVVADSGAAGGTCLRAIGGQLQCQVTGPATLRFSGKGALRYSATKPFTAYGYSSNTPNPIIPRWDEFKINLPAGLHNISFSSTSGTAAFLDCLTVAPFNLSAAQAAVDYSGPLSFPGYGEWAVDGGDSVFGGESLRRPLGGDHSISLPVTGPAVVRYCLILLS